MCYSQQEDKNILEKSFFDEKHPGGAECSIFRNSLGRERAPPAQQSHGPTLLGGEMGGEVGDNWVPGCDGIQTGNKPNESNASYKLSSLYLCFLVEGNFK